MRYLPLHLHFYANLQIFYDINGNAIKNIYKLTIIIIIHLVLTLNIIDRSDKIFKSIFIYGKSKTPLVLNNFKAYIDPIAKIGSNITMISPILEQTAIDFTSSQLTSSV